MTMTVPERTDLGDCDRCGARGVRRRRLQYSIIVRDWTSDDPRATKEVVLRDALCEDCYGGGGPERAAESPPEAIDNT